MPSTVDYRVYAEEIDDDTDYQLFANILGKPGLVGVTQSDLTKTYRRLAMQTHPDRWKEEDREEMTKKFQQISNIYEELTEALTKGAMDEYLYQADADASSAQAHAYASSAQAGAQRVCKFYQRGVCKFPNNCRNMHPPEQEDTRRKRTQRTQRAKSGSTNVPYCKYAKQGYCKFGVECRYRHPNKLCRNGVTCEVPGCPYKHPIDWSVFEIFM